MSASTKHSSAWCAALLAAGLIGALLAAGCSGGAERRSAYTGPISATQSAEPAEGSDTAASGEAKGAPHKEFKEVEYRLGPGDQLAVSVFGQQDLSGKFEVDGNGNLVLPLVGQIKAGDKTVNEVQANLTDELNKSFVVNPKVTVQVLNYRPFYILGEVIKAGSYPYVVGVTVRQAIAIAGGYTRRGRVSPVKIIHAGKAAADAEEAIPDDLVLPGDTIEVERRMF